MSALILVNYKAKAGKGEAFVKAIKEAGLQQAVLNEDGCQMYEYYLEAGATDNVLLVEKWQSKEDQQVHLKQPHMAEVAKIKEEFIEDTKVEIFEV